MLRGIWLLVNVVVWTVICGTLAILLTPLMHRRFIAMRAGRFWSRRLLAAAGVRVDYRGLEHAEGPQPRVFICNHQSIVDIWSLFPVLPLPAVFVAKRSLFRIPVLGWAMRSAGFIPIVRERLDKALRSLDVAARRIADGRSVLLFAEGTRSRSGVLGRFKKGAFHLAIGVDAPVVPVSVSGSFDKIRPRSLVVRPGRVRVTFGDPVDVAPYRPADFNGLRNRVRRAIAAGLEPGELPPEDRADRRDAPEPRTACR